MILKGYKKDNHWIYTEWQVTYPMNWTKIVFAANSQLQYIKDYAVFYGKTEHELRDITSAVLKSNGDLSATGLLKINASAIKIRGTMYDMPIDITLTSESEFVQVTFYFNGDFPEDEDNGFVIKWLYNMFGVMLDSMEIMGHLKAFISDNFISE
jgi:hypothetical protein